MLPRASWAKQAGCFKWLAWRGAGRCEASLGQRGCQCPGSLEGKVLQSKKLINVVNWAYSFAQISLSSIIDPKGGVVGQTWRAELLAGPKKVHLKLALLYVDVCHPSCNNRAPGGSHIPQQQFIASGSMPLVQLQQLKGKIMPGIPRIPKRNRKEATKLEQLISFYPGSMAPGDSYRRDSQTLRSDLTHIDEEKLSGNC